MSDNQTIPKASRRFLTDASLIAILAILAGCGIIYEYLLSHYAGRVLGLMEHAIFTMIGVMIVSMGVGALIAKKIKDATFSFVVIELCIAIIGSISIILIASVMALSSEFPKILAANYGLPSDLIPVGGVIKTLAQMTEVFPFVIGFILGALVGMEIPLIARIREDVYASRIEHNTGTVYGVDYLGAGIGAAIFIIFLLNIAPARAAIWVAYANLFVGFAFLALRWKQIKFAKILLGLHIVVGVSLVFLLQNVGRLNAELEDILYKDEVIFSQDTDFQHLTLTQKQIGSGEPIYNLFINGRSQFCSCDEALYHAMLINPPIMAAARHQNILLIGGGDGLAIRDILKWQPQQIDVLELDQKMVALFSEPVEQDGVVINQALLTLNQNAFGDERVQVIYGDAFNSVDALIAQQKKYDVLIVDLPDPSHPDLNKLYSTVFYKKLRQLLSGDGAISIQSTSPYHARDAFLTVGVTLRAAGFDFVERYHANIPSFGEWGWSIATIKGRGAKARIADNLWQMPENTLIDEKFILASFEFPHGLIESEKSLIANSLDSNLSYVLHEKSWLNEEINVGK